MASKFGNAKPGLRQPSFFERWLSTPEGQEAFARYLERLTMKGPAR